MVYSADIRWRAIVLYSFYGHDVEYVHYHLGVAPRTIRRWIVLFDTTGDVVEKKEVGDDERKKARWAPEVVEAVSKYVTDHPTFYFEELQRFVVETYPDTKHVSFSTICRVLRFDMGLSRKKLTRAAREAVPMEIRDYFLRLGVFYTHPNQLVFVDETSKNGRDAFRHYGWSARNTKCVVNLPCGRGKRISVIAALSTQGFIGWGATDGTFRRSEFHTVFKKENCNVAISVYTCTLNQPVQKVPTLSQHRNKSILFQR